MDNSRLNKRVLFAALVFFLLVENSSFAQPACPTVTVSPNNISICTGCTTLSATVQGTVATTSYSVSPTPYVPYPFTGPNPVLVNIDDTWSAVVPIPFCFSFYGNTYNQCIIGSNAEISFEVANAGSYNTWPISAAVPTSTPSDLLNSIMGPWHDIDPSVTSFSTPTITWGIYGTSPCRAFVVSWTNVSMFSCNAMIATSQIVLYETTSIIDIYIQDKPLCSTWNGGNAIEGIQDATGTQAVTVPGRNYPAQWTATNDGQRFTPTGAPQYTVTWFAPPNTPLGNALTVTVCPTTTTTYTATVVNNTCSGPITVSDMATVIIGSGAITMTMTPTTCSGNSGSATATPTGGTAPFTYAWNPTGQTTPTATGLGAGTYTATVTDASGCSGTQTITVTSNSGLAATATTTPTNCTAHIGTATANPTGGTPPFTYLWNPTAQNTPTATGLGTGTYSVTVTDANGCSTTITALVTSPNGITGVATAATQTKCNGGSDGTATATPAGGTAPYIYLWNTSPAQATQTATGLSATNYSVTVTDANGCTFPATVLVTQPAATSAPTSTTADTCGKKQGTATATPSGGTAPYTYIWLTNPIQSTVTAMGLIGGNYSCIITDANGCTVISQASVANIPGPTANFLPAPQVVDILDANVDFFDLSTNATTWLWDFGDGPPTSTLHHPIHTYQSEGTYLVTLIVTNAQGCPDTISETVVVEGYTSFYVPNTFTPNGDGRNEFFTPVFSRIDSSAFSMQIFDRWGNELFKTITPGDYWDGRAYRSGPLVEEDVYVYVITYRDIKKKDHKLIGNVNVVK